jgi:hypothetical protein
MGEDPIAEGDGHDRDYPGSGLQNFVAATEPMQDTTQFVVVGVLKKRQVTLSFESIA